MANRETVTCQIRYKLDLNKLGEFEKYARAWMGLVERYGGTHHGYFMPRAAPNGVRTSFPKVGHDGPSDVAIALFTFPNERSYLRYREMVAADPECQSAEALYNRTHCFLSYERLFLQQVEHASPSSR
ncbi:MAG TPA: NIPSNAP family protein [Edaphobacter sp.]|nr:NIPSNAP family protein [Edaphobacter sp.]